MSSDRFTSEIVKDGLVALGEEMFNAMIRTSMSPIIYESTDFAVGATDAQGNLLAQGNGVTGFLAALDTAVQSTLHRYPLSEIADGDVFITNNPYEGGGTHLSDVVIVCPVFDAEELVAWTVNKAHWTEVGGAFPGSASTISTDIYQEGIQLNFLKLYRRGDIDSTLVEVIRANVRLPDSTIGDMHAGVASCRVGARRIRELIAKYGRGAVLNAMRELLDYGERMTLIELGRIPAGTYQADDVIEEDGLGNGPFKICASVTITSDSMVIDYAGTSDQAAGPINCSRAALITAARCIFKAVTNPDLPANGGCFRPLEVRCPDGTIITARKPAPVSIYYESLIAAIEVVWKALQPVLPDRLPVGHFRSVGATFISGRKDGEDGIFVMGEPLVGGWGAGPDRDGDSGQFCCGNGETFNVPVELVESRYGLEVVRYEFNSEPGGEGQRRGGRGVVREYRVACPEARLTYSSSRTSSTPWGAENGLHGSTNRAEVVRNDGSVEHYTMTTNLALARGDRIRLLTGNAGGYGDPQLRPREHIERDIRDGFLTNERAADVYGYRADA